MQIQLVPPQAEFAEIFYRWRCEPSSVRHNPLDQMDLAACKARLSSEGHDLQDLWSRSSFRWFVSVGGKIVGNVSLKNISKMMATAEIGYAIGEEFQGQGVGTNAVRALVGKVFRETKLRKLMAYVHDENVSSCKLVQKLGFQKEGLLREHYLINGMPANEVVFGLLRREWKE